MNLLANRHVCNHQCIKYCVIIITVKVTTVVEILSQINQSASDFLSFLAQKISQRSGDCFSCKCTCTEIQQRSVA